MLTLEYFDRYTSMGFEVIPLYQKSKVPVGNNWNRRWDHDKCRRLIEEWPEYNLGILLGRVLDVEADTDESNDLLKNLIGDHPHPMYKSSRSIHHLFLNPDTSLTATKIYGIEFRGYRHQSVVPPSIHEDGNPYSWLKETSWPIPHMPAELMDFYKKNRKKNSVRPTKPKTKKGHSRTTCNACGSKVFIHKKRLVLEVRAFREHGLLWQCHNCRKLDLREECRYLRKIAKEDNLYPFHR